METKKCLKHPTKGTQTLSQNPGNPAISSASHTELDVSPSSRVRVRVEGVKLSD